jgi:CYTH domain-containing protein
MAEEIERKYVVDPKQWKPKDAGVHFKQGYLSSHKERVVRIRIEGATAKLTVKGITRGIRRAEFEYAIPVGDAVTMLDTLCEQPLIEKRRYKEVIGGRTWEIDVFLGDNEGLVLAEVELKSEDDEIEVPPWAIREVSNDPRYYNSNLLKLPYKAWGN